MNGEADEPIFAAARSEPFTRGDDGISARDFKESFGEEIRAALDLASWRNGTDVEQEYRRLEREVKDAVHRETKLQTAIRSEIFPRLKTQPKGPKNAGVHTADPATLARIHKEFLFNGGVEACDGAIEIHNTLPLTIYQIGVTLVSYQGDRGTWSQRLFRRDLQQSFENRLDAVLASLERRQNRAESGEGLGELVQKALLDWAERAILLKRATAPWRMGHGNPITYELLTGGGNLELMVEGTNVLRELIENHQKFVFVSEEPRDELLLTIGHALRPMEFAIVSTLDDRLEHWLHQKRFAANDARVKWDGESIPATEWIPRFIRRVASRVVVGVFRAGEVAPPQVFYAHEDHADLAAYLAIADSVLQEHRGAPMLLEMARHVCRTVFGDSLGGLTQNAFAAAGAPWRFAPTRSSR